MITFPCRSSTMFCLTKRRQSWNVWSWPPRMLLSSWRESQHPPLIMSISSSKFYQHQLVTFSSKFCNHTAIYASGMLSVSFSTLTLLMQVHGWNSGSDWWCRRRGWSSERSIWSGGAVPSSCQPWGYGSLSGTTSMWQSRHITCSEMVLTVMVCMDTQVMYIYVVYYASYIHLQGMKSKLSCNSDTTI